MYHYCTAQLTLLPWKWRQQVLLHISTLRQDYVMSYSRKQYSRYSLFVGSCVIVSLIIIVATLMHYSVGPFLIHCCALEACTLTNARRYLNLSGESEISCSTFFRLSDRSHTTTWPLLQPPASRFSLYGQNCSAWTLRGVFSINCKSINGMIIVFQNTVTIWNHVQLKYYDISDSDDSKYSDYCLLGWHLVVWLIVPTF